MRIGELSRRTEVTPDLLRVWERRYGLLRPRRTGGNARLYSALDEARVKLMCRHLAAGVSAREAAELALAQRLAIAVGSAARIPDGEADRAAWKIAAALERFEETVAEQVLGELLSGFSAAAVIRDVLFRVMRSETVLGSDALSARLAGNFLESRMLSLARGWDRGLGPRALLACAPGDGHTLGSIAFGIVLHSLGWRIVYLGASSELSSVARAATRIMPELVVLSGAVTGCLEDHRASLSRLAAEHPLALAGGAASPELAEACPALLLDGDPVSAALGLVAGERLAESVVQSPAEARRQCPVSAPRIVLAGHPVMAGD